MSAEWLREHGCEVEKVDADVDVYLVSRGKVAVPATARDIEYYCERVLWSLLGDEEDEE